jgi:hypothetical protein
MSSLLEQAIVDAKALKEAALKNAENLVVEKYAQEIKNTMQTLLEQEEPALGADPLDALAAPPTEEAEEKELHKVTKKLPDAFITSDDEQITINLDELDAHIHEAIDLQEKKGGQKILHDDFPMSADVSLEEEEGVTIDEMLASLEGMGLEEFDLGEEEAPVEDETAPDADLHFDPREFDSEDPQMSMEPPPEEDPQMSMEPPPEEDPTMSTDPESGEEALTVDDEYGEYLAQLRDINWDPLISEEEVSEDELAEALRFHGTPRPSGWEGTPNSQVAQYEEMALAMLNDSELAEELEKIAKIKKALQKENKDLKASSKIVIKENSKLLEAVGYLKKKVENVNVSNAKLLYINQTLENVSLNERQKQNIVEAISTAGTVGEAKIIYETLQNSVSGTKKQKVPESLSEAVTTRSSLLLAARQNKQKDEPQSPFFDRMQKLAGIKN